MENNIGKDTNDYIHEYLKNAREEIYLKVEDVEEMYRYITNAEIELKQIEDGTKKVPIDALEFLCEIYGYALKSFMGNEKEQRNVEQIDIEAGA